MKKEQKNNFWPIVIVVVVILLIAGWYIYSSQSSGSFAMASDPSCWSILNNYPNLGGGSGCHRCVTTMCDAGYTYDQTKAECGPGCAQETMNIGGQACVDAILQTFPPLGTSSRCARCAGVVCNEPGGNYDKAKRKCGNLCSFEANTGTGMQNQSYQDGVSAVMNNSNLVNILANAARAVASSILSKVEECPFSSQNSQRVWGTTGPFRNLYTLYRCYYRESKSSNRTTFLGGSFNTREQCQSEVCGPNEQ